GVSIIIRLNNEGTLHYINLPSSNKFDFVKEMSYDIATAINCDASRIAMPTLYQYSNENNHRDQIFMRVNIVQRDDQSASSLASKLSETLIYKNISEISNGTILNYIDQSNGAWLMPNLWDKYKFFLTGIFVGLALYGTLHVGFGKAIKWKHAITNFFTIFLPTLIVVDLMLDILFIVFHGKDEKWVMLVSHELNGKRYQRFWTRHSRTALVTTLLSWFDVEALNVASSLNAPYTPEACRSIFYANNFILFIEDVPHLIFLTIYQKVTIIPTIVPILALSSCRILIFIKIMSIIFFAYFNDENEISDDESIMETVTSTHEENIYIQGNVPDRPQIQIRQEIFDELIEVRCRIENKNMRNEDKVIELREITEKYECDKNVQLTSWEIDIDRHKLVYKNNYEKQISFAGICNDYLGSHLLHNDDLIVIATNCIVIFTFSDDIKDGMEDGIKNEIQIIYYRYIDIDKFMTTFSFKPFSRKKNLWDSDIAQLLGKMLTLYLDDIYIFSCCSPFIMESMVKYDNKRKYRKHDNEIISLIIDKCINYYNEDNSRFDVLCAITNSISKFQKLYPYLVTKFFICTSIFSYVDEKIDYALNSHLDGSRDEFPEPNLNMRAMIIGGTGLFILLNIGLFIVNLSGVQVDTFEWLVTAIISIIYMAVLCKEVISALDDRKVFYPTIKLLIPLPKFASYPTKYNLFTELLKPASNEFYKDSQYKPNIQKHLLNLLHINDIKEIKSEPHEAK
ncbi:6628_t:CDS:2, partial [Gigaspora rosea]